MGRPVKTPEQRAANLSEVDRVNLLALQRARDTARANAEAADVQLVEAIEEVVSQGASFRDVAATLGMPHQSVHGWIKRHSTTVA